MQASGRLGAVGPRLARAPRALSRAVAQQPSAAARAGHRRRAAAVRASAASNGEPAQPPSSSALNPLDNLNAPPFPAPTMRSSSSNSSSSSSSSNVSPAATVGGGGDGGGNGGGGGGGNGGGGGGGDDKNNNNNDNNNGDNDDDVLLDANQAEAAALSAKIELPADMRLAARTVGLRSTALSRYAALRGLTVTGALAARFPSVRDRLLADERFLFKVWAECAIDAGCATVAEVRKRGEHFWGELELYASDLIVGLVLDVVLVALMAPAAAIGGGAVVAAGRGGAAAVVAGGPAARVAAAARRALAGVPSAVFAPSQPGSPKYTPLSRVACLGVKFLEYSLAGIVCGLIGQAAANGLIVVKRRVQQSQRERQEQEERERAAREGPKALRAHDRAVAAERAARHARGEVDPFDAPMPPIVGTALVWGIFMGVSSNLRYQAVFGVERLVAESSAARAVPALCAAATVAVRFANNVVGGEQFIDFARYFGVQ